MFRIILFFIFTMVGLSTINGIFDNSTGLASTKLNGDLSSSANTIAVDSTVGFPSSGGIWIDNEYITYTGITATTFTGASRGASYGEDAKSTDAASHADNRGVYNHKASALNRIMNLEFSTSDSLWGKVTAPINIVKTFVAALWQVIMWDYTFLEPIPELKVVLSAITGAFILFLGISFIVAIRSS